MGLLDSIFGLDSGGSSAPSTAFSDGGASGYWGQSPEWQQLDDVTKAAVMAYLEADSKNGKVDLGSASNALGAMINRADKEGESLGQHVSKKIYQPTIEPAQYARVGKALQSEEVAQLKQLAQERLSGQREDWVSGATHFLAPERTMLSLEAKEPGKYKNWGPRGQNWTGYDPATGEYRGVVMRDASHAFLAPSGAHSAKFGTPREQPPDGMDVAAYSPAPGTATIPQVNPGTVAQDGKVAPATFGSLAATAGQNPASDLSSLKGLVANAGKMTAKMQGAQTQRAASVDGALPPMAALGKVDLSRILELLAQRGPLGTIEGA
ncbi:MAG: hypothetical protein ACKVP3_23655 [Hyphomicrobiaceae bacterium]